MPSSNVLRTTKRTAPTTPSSRSNGQILVIFAGALMVLMLMAAVVVDVSWYWVNSLRVQRAADAAALAGAVELPKFPDAGAGHAYDLAYKEAAKNGYTNGVGGVVVTPLQDATFSNRLNVTIDAPVGTFFMKLIGIKTIAVERTAKAEYVQPVPMGSPQNYYGIGYLVKPVTTTSTSNSNGTTSLQDPNSAPNGGTWQFTNGRNNTITNVVQDNDNDVAFSSTINAQQQWATFGLATGFGNSPIPNPAGNQTLTIRGVEVDLSDVFINQNCGNNQNVKLQIELSWNNGQTWSTPQTTNNLTNSTNTDFTFGNTTSNTGWGAGNAGWGAHNWIRADLTDANFRVRATYLNTNCGTRTLSLDQLAVRVGYTTSTTTTTTTLQQNAPVSGPNGEALTPQKFWGAMNSQGSPSIQGDAFMTKYERRTGTLNVKNAGQDPDAVYDPTTFYNYAVEVPAGASNATIWVYDPGFCDATSEGGLGEYWSSGNTDSGENLGPDDVQPISAFFDVWNTNGTTGNNADDTLLTSTGNNYRRLDYQDQAVYDARNMNTSEPDCTGQSWHYNWVPIASGLSAGTYRVHSYSTDPNSSNDQNNSTGVNAFAFFANATGGTPRIYGLGAMEAYVRLPGGQPSEFYLAQIDKANAGKIMYIDLWDPGDTGDLGATLQILAPTGSGFSPTQFNYSASVGTTNRDASGCGNRTGTNVTSVTTNTGGNSLYNGCWLRIQVSLPSNYSAPTDPVSGEKGWWKIRYIMSGSSSDFSTDLTTWQVTLHNNPVHLVVP